MEKNVNFFATKTKVIFPQTLFRYLIKRNTRYQDFIKSRLCTNLVAFTIKIMLVKQQDSLKKGSRKIYLLLWKSFGSNMSKKKYVKM